MYIVQAKIKGEAAESTVEKEFKYKANAIKEASKTVNRGYVILDNPEIAKKDRRKAIKHVTVFDSERPELNIDF